MLRIESTICEIMGRTWGCQTRMINFNEKMIGITIMRRFDATLTENISCTCQRGDTREVGLTCKTSTLAASRCLQGVKITR